MHFKSRSSMQLSCILVLVSYVVNLALVTVTASTVQVQIDEDIIDRRNVSERLRSIIRYAKSAEMQNYMNAAVNPCDDFFQFACSNWARINPTSDVQPKQTSYFEYLKSVYQTKQLRLLRAGTQPDDTDRATITVKDFYAACRRLTQTRPHRNRHQHKQHKLQLRGILNEFGHMPALLPDDVSAQSMDFDWVSVLGKIQNTYGIDIILHVSIRPDFENKTRNRIFVGPPKLDLQTEAMYTSEATKWHRERYLKKIENHLIEYLGVEQKRASMTAQNILDFETQLAKGLIDIKTSKTLRSLTKERTIEELLLAYSPAIDFKTFLNRAFGNELNVSVYEYMPSYQENLARIVRRALRPNLANYIFYQLAKVFIFDGETDTTTNVVDNERLCLDKTKLFFADVLDNMLYRQLDSNATEIEIAKLWWELKAAFKQNLASEKLNWITAATRQLTFEKLNAMRLQINNYVDIDFNAELAAVNITSDNYVDNLRQMLQHKTKRAIASLNATTAQPFRPLPTVLSHTPVYIPVENLIKLPISILQPYTLFSPFYPKALEYGTLGYLIAHELIHGFDDIGCNYDVHGHARHWWDADTTRAFNERKECFKRQYARYIYGGKYLPESELQAENIADNGAIQIAFDAYLNWLQRSDNDVDADADGQHEGDDASADGNEKSITPDITTEAANLSEIQLVSSSPAVAAAKAARDIEGFNIKMNFTNQQLFFIAFAQLHCNDMHSLLKDKVSLVDLHAPAMFRVIGSLANFHAFANAFQCPIGTQMNAAHKCQIY